MQFLITDYFRFLTRYRNCYLIEFMKFAIVLSLFFALSAFTKLPERLAGLSSFLQKSCSSFVHYPQFHKSSDTAEDIVDAYLCGVDLPEGRNKSIFIQTSLYHLIVVSGSHLVFFSLILETLAPSLPQPVHFFTYLALALVTGMQAPILRAFFCSTTKTLSPLLRLHWSPLFTLLMGSFLGLCLFPSWVQSSSFLLSLGATLSLFAGQTLLPPTNSKNAFHTHILVYIFLLPLLWGWGQLHPFGILTNLVIAPTLSVVLWALCGLWFLWPTGATMAIELLVRGLGELADWMPLMKANDTASLLSKWVYLLGLIYFLWANQLKVSRQNHKPSGSVC